MMKYIIIMIMIMSTQLISADDLKIQIIKKGEVSPYEGILIPAKEYERMYQIMQIYEATQLLEKNLTRQIQQYEAMMQLKDQQMALLEQKFTIENNLRLQYQKQYEKSELATRILVITTCVSVSISLAEFAGIGIYALLQNVKM